MLENKSNKQKHHAWAHELVNKFEPLKLNAEKFSNQLFLIFESRAGDYLETVNTRHTAAKNYFYPVLKELSKTILIHIELLKDEKQIKSYIEELLELEGLLFKHLQQLDKISTVIDNVLHNVEFNKQQIRQNVNQNERLNLVRNSIAIAEKAKFEERKSKKSEKSSVAKVKKEKVIKENKQVKPDTKEASFILYKEGKSAFEIAKERGFAITTIEGHLAHYVSLGMIPVTQFVSKEKYATIIGYSKKMEGENLLTPLKQQLGDEYSYSEIRFTLATQKHLKKE